MAYAKISHTGVHKGRIQVVNAFYLEPTDPNYDKHYVQVVDTSSDAFLAGYKGEVDTEGRPRDKEAYKAWWESLPLVWQNNPFHNHVLYFGKDTSDAEIKDKIEEALNYFYTFHATMWDTDKVFIDEWKKVPKKKDTIRSPFVKGDLSPENIADCEAKAIDIKEREADILPFIKGTKSVDLNIGDKGTIDVGDAAIDRDTWVGSDTTRLSSGNKADGTGTIDTVEIYACPYGDMLNTAVGMFYLISSTTYKCRDSQVVGTVPDGTLEEFTGLSIDVETDDLIGSYFTAGYLENDNSGAGFYWINGDYTTPGDQALYTEDSAESLSIYGTGTESGGAAAFIPRVCIF